MEWKKNDKILNIIKSKKAHFFEKDINGLLEKYVDNGLYVSGSLSGEYLYDALIITVGTPFGKEGDAAIGSILEVIDALSSIYTGKELIVLRSTVSVGVTRKLVVEKLSEISGVNKEEVLAAFCPERTVEGDAINELVTIPQIVGANNDKSYELAETLFKKNY